MTIEMINDAPTIDAVPVVRCRDCKHYLGLAECEFEGHFSGGTDYFCSYGEGKIKKDKKILEVPGRIQLALVDKS